MAASFKKKHDRLDVLVNNAAVLKNKRIVTPDGLETMFATNHLGPFLLTNLLLDELKAAGRARIINVTAPSTVKLDFDDLQGERKFNALTAFGASKMCNLLFTYELARRLGGSGVTANALHPGLMKSNLLNEAPSIMRWLSHLASSTPDRGAEVLVYMASSSEVEGVTGRFFKDKKLINSSKYSNDPGIQRQLWDASIALAGLN
jgi:NAD(P)-dependent dehydrogenase (short-subunit alcohol dehydrogenase family)